MRQLETCEHSQPIFLGPSGIDGCRYPVHQRGVRMAFTNFALYGGAFFTPVIVGKMTSTMGWRWPFYFVAIFSAVFFPFVSRRRDRHSR